MKQNKQSAPYWRVSLANLCRMLSGLQQEAWGSEEEAEEDGELREGSLQLLEELYNLQHICRSLQSREERVRRTRARTHKTHTYAHNFFSSHCRCWFKHLYICNSLIFIFCLLDNLPSEKVDVLLYAWHFFFFNSHQSYIKKERRERGQNVTATATNAGSWIYSWCSRSD